MNNTDTSITNNDVLPITQITDFCNMKVSTGGYGMFGIHSVDSTMHRHSDIYEIVLILSGNYEHTYAKKTDSLPAGTLLLLSPYSTHRLYTEPMKASHFVTCVEQEYFRNFAARCFPADLHIDAIPECFITHLDAREADFIQMLAYQLCSASPSQTAADTILYLTLANVRSKNLSHSRSHPDYIDELISVLNNPVYLNMSTKELCKDFDESPSTILRNFKKHTGCTIVEYKNKRRLALSAEMLLNSELKITDIALNLQYESLSYFLRVFKKEYGMTPTQYREKFRTMQKADFTLAQRWNTPNL